MAKLTLSFKGRILKVYPLPPGEVLIGRGPQCQIRIDSLAVEPEHARIITRDGESIIQDLAGDGGVQVNRRPATEHHLRHGDVIQVGKHTLSYAEEPVGAGAAESEAHEAGAPTPGRAWLQIQSGPNVGKIVPLDRALVRLGKPGRQTAVIAHRATGYYLSHLEGDPPPKVGDVTVSEHPHALRDGDVIQIGDVTIQFFLDESSPS